jgi:hypothetical protein
MANYGYLHLERRITPDDLEAKLKGAVQAWFGDRMTVQKANFRDDGPVWVVVIPGTRAWNKKGPLPCNQDVGFAVALQKRGKAVAFRHGPSLFENWAQGCIEEQLSETFGVGVFYDASGETHPVGEVEYRRGKTFKEYMSRNFDRHLSQEDREYIENFRAWAPPGWWD